MNEMGSIELLTSMDPYRVAVRQMVAVFVADGFSDEQARELVAYAFAYLRRGETEGE